MWHAFSSPLTLLIRHPTSKPSFFILKNNLSFLSALLQSQHFGRPNSLSSRRVCVCARACVLNPPCPCSVHYCYILIPYCCSLHELTWVIFNHVLWCDFIGHCAGTHTCTAAVDISSKYLISCALNNSYERVVNEGGIFSCNPDNLLKICCFGNLCLQL